MRAEGRDDDEQQHQQRRIAGGKPDHEQNSADEQILYVTCVESDELAILDVSDPIHPTVTKKLKVGPNPDTPNTSCVGALRPPSFTARAAP